MASGSEALTLPTIQVACGFGGQKEGIGATVHCPLCIFFLKSRMGYCFEGYFSLAVTYVKRAHSLLVMFITKLLRIVYTYVPRLKRPVVTRTFDHNNTGRLYGQHAAYIKTSAPDRSSRPHRARSCFQMIVRSPEHILSRRSQAMGFFQ